VKLAEIVGKRISRVVHAKDDVRSGRKAVFLIFDDGTHVELWGDDFSWSSPRQGDVEDVLRYAKQLRLEAISIHPG